MNQDRQWIQQLRRGNGKALQEVYAATKDELFSLALMLCRDRALAEDVLQDVFVQLASKAGVLKIHGSLRAYLATCVVNRVRSHYRRQRESVTLDQANAVSNETPPEANMTQRELVRQVAGAVSQLPPDQREVVVLHLHSGLTFKVIARQLDVSINTVQSRYRYGLAKLRTLLNGEMEQ